LLREEGTIPPVLETAPPYHDVLERYCHFLVHDRGLANRTVGTYSGFIRVLSARLRRRSAAPISR
jgi:hypothetical protein